MSCIQGERFGSSPIQEELVELDIKRSRHSLNKRRRPIIRDSNGFMLPVMGTGDRSKRDAVTQTGQRLCFLSGLGTPYFFCVSELGEACMAASLR